MSLEDQIEKAFLNFFHPSSLKKELVDTIRDAVEVWNRLTVPTECRICFPKENRHLMSLRAFHGFKARTTSTMPRLNMGS